MKRLWWLVLAAVFAAATSLAYETEAERRARQAELDAICEAARQDKIKPLREELVEECVEKEQRPDRTACERFYKDYGERTGARDPLFYDLPECLRAHEYRTSYRQSDN